MGHASLVYAGVAALMVLVVGATVAYLPQSPVSTQATEGMQNSGQKGSENGLILGASLNASVVSPGNTLSLQIWEENSMNEQNNVTAAGGWPYQGLTLGPCGPLDHPFGFMVLAGYYPEDSPSIATANALQLYAPGMYMCPAIIKVGSYSFYPQSTSAVVGGYMTTDSMNVTSYIGHEYTNGSAGPSPLPSGVYTVVVGDEWGATVLVYFVVSSPGSKGTVVLPAGTSIQVSSSYDCVAGHFQIQFATSTESILTGGFKASTQGVTLYVATAQEASSLVQGHPAQWEYSMNLQNSSNFSTLLTRGSYVLWFEGADLNCGAKTVMPLEMLTQVNITQSFTLAPA